MTKRKKVEKIDLNNVQKQFVNNVYAKKGANPKDLISTPLGECVIHTLLARITSTSFKSHKVKVLRLDRTNFYNNLF